MNSRSYYTDLISRLQGLKNTLPEGLSEQERQQVASRISLMQSQARVILAALEQNEDRHCTTERLRCPDPGAAGGTLQPKHRPGYTSGSTGQSGPAGSVV